MGDAAMCELLIVARDTAAEQRGDVVLDAQRPQRGDTVFVAPDGWRWGKKELGSARFRILKLPGVEVAALRSLAGPKPAGGGALARFRAVTIDLDAIEQAAAQELKRGTAAGVPIVIPEARAAAFRDVVLSHRYIYEDLQEGDAALKIAAKSR